jgi:ABC-type Na+ efflux pump permease subunit
MRLDKIWIVAKKDLAEFRTNKYVMYSIILMPLLLSVVLPVLYLAPITFTTSTNEPLDVGNDPILIERVDQTLSNGTYENTSFLRCDLSNVVVNNCRIEGSNLTASLVRDSFVGNSTLNSSALFHSNYIGLNTINSITSSSVDIGGTTEDQKFLIQYLNFLLIFFIMIPVILPTVMASYSFVGEKLNKSLEPLLATPTTDAELLLGKALSIFLPCMLATWLAFVPFVILANYMTAPVLGYSVLPDAVWTIGVFLLAPLFLRI